MSRRDVEQEVLEVVRLAPGRFTPAQLRAAIRAAGHRRFSAWVTVEILRSQGWLVVEGGHVYLGEKAEGGS